VGGKGDRVGVRGVHASDGRGGKTLSGIYPLCASFEMEIKKIEKIKINNYEKSLFLMNKFENM